ncbi:MAG TPA: hypothetical protein VMZ28_12535 [Kofleriaceae bacterium]|nr:hypothetical protein [Kofleriaceae bacterium]
MTTTIATRTSIDPAAILRAFHTSHERALLIHDEDLIWIEELLQIMEAADWDWGDLDRHGLTAILLDGFRWTVDLAPDEPEAVVRALDAFMVFIGRVHRAPHADECSAYLRTPAAVRDIRRWLRPRTRTQRWPA